jgi:hypothetical protein
MHPQILNGKTQEVTTETKHEFVLHISMYRIAEHEFGGGLFFCRDQWLNFSKKIHSFFKRKKDELNNQNEFGEEEQPAVRVCLIEARSENHRQEQEQHVIFQGIEFLERDPTLCLQIWEYPSNQQNEVQRAYLKLGPMQPKLKNYKASGPQGHQHCFQYQWFSEFSSWLEYLESNGCAYYLFCFVFSKNIKKRGGYDAFTVQGFNNWKKLHDRKNCAFLVHVDSDPSSEHNSIRSVMIC